MNIPDEAFDAAYEAYWASGSSIGAALEAAAPHLMAAAWERGREDGYHHRPNPYRSGGAGE